MIRAVDVAALIAQLDEHGLALASAADAAGLDAAVPTCPGWDVRALLAHIGMVHRWAAGVVRAEPDAAKNSDHPAPPDGVVEWFRSGHAALVEALSAAPADLDVWSFLPAPSPLAFWARRQAHETAIHRADAEAAVGQTPTFDDTFALDGIAELLEGFYARKGGKFRADPGFSLHVAPDGSDVSWTMQVDADGRTVTRHDSAAEAASADCTIRGSSQALYLELWNRGTDGAIHTTGDANVMQQWRKLATVTWS